MVKKIIFLLIISLLVVAPVYAKTKNKLLVYPNPWIPESGKSLNTDRGDEMKHGAYTADGWIKFEGIDQGHRSESDSNYGGDLRIYDITGHLVKSKNWRLEDEKNLSLPQHTREARASKNKTDHPNDVRNHIVHWDGKNNDYEYVESGVYIWIIREDDGSKYDGKVVVVR